jgi:hypothetical protein
VPGLLVDMGVMSADVDSRGSLALVGAQTYVAVAVLTTAWLAGSDFS